MNQLIITPNLAFETIAATLSHDVKVALSPELQAKVLQAHQYLQHKITDTDALYYGINTGFGALCNVKINAQDLAQLQENLVLSHACGMGETVPVPIVKLMLLLKIIGLAQGHSGISRNTLDLLIALYNNNLIPVVYTQGSLGASGDLAPLAHLALPLIGKGEIWSNGRPIAALTALKAHGLAPVTLGAKEGLALLNGTQFMLSYLVYNCAMGLQYCHQANAIAALSIDGFLGLNTPFHPLVHAVRPHKGQVEVAHVLDRYLSLSTLSKLPKTHVQDPYAFRCIPQVHGASLDTLNYVKGIAQNELNAVSDNPLIFPDEDLILSGGNFHGQPLALALDFLAIALAELAAISERRTYQLISGQRDLPAFLTPNPGLNSGLMIHQYAAASAVSQNKQLCTPASVDSIVSSNGQEDHVSMGANAATKCYQVVNNLKNVLGIELINASQALFFRAPLTPSTTLMPWLNAFRAAVPIVHNDRLAANDIHTAAHFIAEHIAPTFE